MPAFGAGRNKLCCKAKTQKVGKGKDGEEEEKKKKEKGGKVLGEMKAMKR